MHDWVLLVERCFAALLGKPLHFLFYRRAALVQLFAEICCSTKILTFNIMKSKVVFKKEREKIHLSAGSLSRNSLRRTHERCHFMIYIQITSIATFISSLFCIEMTHQCKTGRQKNRHCSLLFWYTMCVTKYTYSVPAWSRFSHASAMQFLIQMRPH